MKILKYFYAVVIGFTPMLAAIDTNENIGGCPYMGEESSLANKTCIPCNRAVPPLKGEALSILHKQLGNGWQLIDRHHLEKEYQFKDFAQALAFTNQIGAVAEKEGHHPNIHLSWGKVKILLWTNKIDGLSESDFILAAKIDKIKP